MMYVENFSQAQPTFPFMSGHSNTQSPSWNGTILSLVCKSTAPISYDKASAVIVAASGSYVVSIAGFLSGFEDGHNPNLFVN